MAGGLISLTSVLMLLSPLTSRLVHRYGTRIVIIVAQNLCAVALVMLFLTGDPKPIGLLYWVVASLGAAALDVVGNIPFMRMVKPRERTEMTMIFSTWREASNLLTPLLVMLVLLVAPIEVFYLLLALLLVLASVAAATLTLNSKSAGRLDFVHVNVLLRVGDGNPGFIEADLDGLEQFPTYRPVVGAVYPGAHEDVNAAVAEFANRYYWRRIFQDALIGVDYRLDDVACLADVVVIADPEHQVDTACRQGADVSDVTTEDRRIRHDDALIVGCVHQGCEHADFID
jgi:MFS family permease